MFLTQILLVIMIPAISSLWDLTEYARTSISFMYSCHMGSRSCVFFLWFHPMGSWVAILLAVHSTLN